MNVSKNIFFPVSHFPLTFVFIENYYCFVVPWLKTTGEKPQKDCLNQQLYCHRVNQKISNGAAKVVPHPPRIVTWMVVNSTSFPWLNGNLHASTKSTRVVCLTSVILVETIVLGPSQYHISQSESLQKHSNNFRVFLLCFGIHWKMA